MDCCQEASNHVGKDSEPYLGNHSCLCLHLLLEKNQIQKGWSVTPISPAELGKAWCVSLLSSHCKWALCLFDPCLQRAHRWRCLQRTKEILEKNKYKGSITRPKWLVTFSRGFWSTVATKKWHCLLCAWWVSAEITLGTACIKCKASATLNSPVFAKFVFWGEGNGHFE